jgi:hypothetical protein
MTAIEYLQKKLPQFTWTKSSDNIIGRYGVKKTTKRINKDLYELIDVVVFISGKMGGTPNNPPFRYAMCWQGGRMRPYRRKTFHGVEYQKIFVSGKNLNETIKKLVKEIDMDKYFI